MKDIEIFEWLYELEPESELQEKKLKKMMSIILEKPRERPVVTDVNVEKFLTELSVNDVLNKTTIEVYIKYSEWCNKNNITPRGKNIFCEVTQNKFNIKSCVTRVNGKLVRLYKRDV